MLDRLTALLASVLGAQPPLAVATLEAMGLLLEVLGEIPEKQVQSLAQAVSAKLISDCTCLRMQVGTKYFDAPKLFPFDSVEYWTLSYK